MDPSVAEKIFLVMGVTGTGKTTVGKKLAAALAIPFFDGDDFHDPQNIRKMKSGGALNDDERAPWLQRLNQLMRAQSGSAVLACSALKIDYRTTLEQGLAARLQWIFLQGKPELIAERLRERTDHFMPAGNLPGQLAILEPPTNAWKFDVENTPDEIVAAILSAVQRRAL